MVGNEMKTKRRAGKLWIIKAMRRLSESTDLPVFAMFLIFFQLQPLHYLTIRFSFQLAVESCWLLELGSTWAWIRRS
jgi:hypothetical protein